MSIKKVNLGCGLRYHNDWINIDFNSHSKSIIKHNILKELPFEDNEIDVIYLSHVLEHFSKSDGYKIIKNCYEKLKPGGIVRAVVPDLENICNEYINILNKIEVKGNDQKYNWIVLELMDQMVRTYPGGEMVEMLYDAVEEKNSFLIDYIENRTGEELVDEYFRENKNLKQRLSKININKVRKHIVKNYLNLVLYLLPVNVRLTLVDKTTIGEKHKWMYDNYSLEKLLKEIGFSKTYIHAYNSSNVENFNKYLLDIREDGKPYKRSSIYCEGVK